MRRLRVAVVAIVVLVGVGVGLLLTPSSRSSGAGRSAAARSPGGHTPSGAQGGVDVATLPPPPSGFAIPTARQLSAHAGVTRWAPVLAATQARERPSPNSPAVVRVGTLTPEGTTNLVVADTPFGARGGEVTRAGVTWVHARLAVLPDSRTGWIPRSSLGGWTFVSTRAVVSRARLTLTLYRGAREIFRTPVGVGKPGTPTPAGRFYIRDRLTRYASPEYGPLAFGTSARSPYVTDWPAGGFIGIHGTNQPGLIPGRISHGCIRLTNSAILALGRLMPVGTPVTIQ